MGLTEAEEIELLALLEVEAASEEARRIAERTEFERRRLETEREQILANCRTLHGFIEEFWHVLEPVAPFRTGWALRAMCDHLEAVTDGHIRRLLITVPPGMMKSLLLVFWTAWEWGPRGMPHIQVLSTSFSQANCFRDNQKLRDLVESDKFQALWPLALRTDSNAVRKFVNTKSGFSEARPFSKMTGGRGNRVKIDDPHDTENAESKVQREKTVRIMREAISDRMNDPSRDAIVLIMQRLHSQDCAAVAKELGYTHLELPMEFEAARRCRTVLRPANDGNPAIIFTDPREREGDLLFPERFPPATVAELKIGKGPYAWACQYQQRPGSRAGGMFQRSWFNRYGPRDLPAVHKFGTSDYAVSADSGDFTVLRIWGVDENSDLWLLPGGYRAQATSDKWIAAQVALIKRHQPFAWFGEGGVIQKAVEPMLIQAMRKADAYTQLVWLPSIASKATRARGFQSRAACGAVWIPEGPEGDSIIEEYAAFLNGGPHDDDVDNGSLIGRALDEAHPAIPAIKPQKKTPGDRWANDENDDSSDWKTA